MGPTVRRHRRSGVDDLLVVSSVDPTKISITNVDFTSGPTGPDGLGAGGLLRSITSGSGVSTTLTYNTLANLGNITTPKSLWTIPVNAMAVTSITTSSGISGRVAQTYASTYTYESPSNDNRDRSFWVFSA